MVSGWRTPSFVLAVMACLAGGCAAARTGSPPPAASEAASREAAENPDALAEMAARFAEAIARGLWRPRRNSPAESLAELAGGRR